MLKMVLSLDAEALYPSIDVVDAARICARRVIESKMAVEGID